MSDDPVELCAVCEANERVPGRDTCLPCRLDSDAAEAPPEPDVTMFVLDRHVEGPRERPAP